MIIDRVEGNIAVVEINKGTYRNVPLDFIGGNVRDGVVLVPSGARYIVDDKATCKRAAELDARRRTLFNKD